MMNAFKRTVAASVLGTTLAVGGLALVATSASAAVAAPTIAFNSPDATFTDYGPNGGYYSGSPRATFAEPLKSLTYRETVTGAGNYVLNYWSNTPIPSWDANDSAFLKDGCGTGCDVTIKKVSATVYDITIDQVNPFTWTNMQGMRVYSNAASAQATMTWDILNVTPVSTNVSENVTNEPVIKGTATWGSVYATPVIAPAIAGIALLGAAGTAGGVFAARRKKQNA